jgi:IS4 transposase
MYSKTRFREILEGLPRGVFDRLVEELNADKYSKGFKCWDQMIAMIFAQLSGLKSLRDVEAAFNQQSSHHYHLGASPVKRSTLSDANTRRSPELFSRVCDYLMKQVHRTLRKELGDLLYLLDSTSIDLRGFGFDDWAAGYRNNVSQGLKLHLMIEGHHGSPVFSRITQAQVSDIRVGRHIPLETGATYVFDMGYYDFNWWYEIDTKGSTFVTRLKKNANVTRIESQDESLSSDYILEDASVRMNSRMTNKYSTVNPYYGKRLRRITVDRPDKDTPLILITNSWKLPPEAIAELYKQRWGIELFFKWIKQNLRIKKFMGRSENAVRTQLWTALICYLLLQLYQRQQVIDSSLKLCLAKLRLSLFQRPETENRVSRQRTRMRKYIDTVQPQLALT